MEEGEDYPYSQKMEVQVSRLFICALAALAMSSLPAAAFEEHCGQGIADVKSMVSSASVSDDVRTQVAQIIREAGEACLSGKSQTAQQLNAYARSMLVDELTDIDTDGTHDVQVAEE